MFGLKRKARERDEAQAADWTAVSDAVLAHIVKELVDVATQALSVTPEPAERERILSTTEAMRRGIDAVLIQGLNAFGPEMAVRDQPEKAAGMISHAARNMAYLSRSLNNPNVRGDLCFAMGFTRDAF